MKIKTLSDAMEFLKYIENGDNLYCIDDRRPFAKKPCIVVVNKKVLEKEQLFITTITIDKIMRVSISNENVAEYYLTRKDAILSIKYLLDNEITRVKIMINDLEENPETEEYDRVTKYFKGGKSYE